ncbi:calcineurin-like phosphoesterase family protein [Flavobacterium lacus]|uniref:Calcineurin-like phosphoesterase family protein n=2 Tax=Flavobacterium lacus TaxID=1353778 RepID=A0A328WJE3_9FLAO|nr:calcineurin-like phosphoesterase family protein [Flavobacterium lacus]
MFRVFITLLTNYKKGLVLLPSFFLFSCATHSIQTGKKDTLSSHQEIVDSSKVSHTFFLLGDAGNTTNPEALQTLKFLESQVSTTDKNSTLLFLGDNIYPKGMPADKNDPTREDAEKKITLQLEIAKNFKGKTIFIPGNHDWYNGLKGLNEQEKFVATYLNEKKAFLPRKGCALETVKINDQIGLIVVDSEWFLQDWDKHPTLNDDCDIRTRLEFFDELKSEINKNQNKFTILAIHHPLMSHGPHGGVFSAKKHLYPINNTIPLPLIGSFINLLRKTTGASPQDLQNKVYRDLINNIKPMIQNRNNVLVVSGHEHNLQYIENDGIKQVISGAASKREAAKAVGANDFSFGGFGYGKLEIYENQSALLTYFSTEERELKKIHDVYLPSPNEGLLPTNFIENKEKTVQASIYSADFTKKSKFYRFLWGDHYRTYYGLPIAAKVVQLDTLFGGVTPTISGGGNQSESLRLADKNGKDYVMRALKKNATRFLQSIFRNQNAVAGFQDTYAAEFIYDFYTSGHPFTPFIIGNLADKIGIYHSNPKLYFIPKQNRLGIFNDSFGDKLYLVEERQTDEHLDLESYGKPQAILGTDDVLANIRKDEKYQVDEEAYIRARLFDMLIGDWDRHQDQWRWSAFEQGDQVIYKPIPRDRDQAFAKVDGNLIRLLLNIPGVRHITNFEADYPSEKWFNFSAHSLDVAFIKNATAADWKKQADYIISELTDEAIDEAFSNLPLEIKDDETTNEIKIKLKFRKKGLEDFALRYHTLLQNRIILTGTDKKDKFLIERLAEGNTKVSWFRLKKDGEELQFSKTYTKKQTKEIWIYGLDDDDQFEVKGKAKNNIIIRLIGGQNHDNYVVENGKKVKIYDYKSKKNTINAENCTAIHLKDDYELNEYHYKKPKYNHTFLLPMIGFNPDDGVKIGGAYNFVKQGFVNNPYTAKHSLRANYYFATEGVELGYKTSFTRIVGKWNLETEARYTTPNFSINYFGYGNETENFDREEGMDYNRVRIQILKVAPSLNYVGRFGSEVTIQTSFENIEVEGTSNRFINEPGAINPAVFDYQQFAGASFHYAFKNYDREANPTIGMLFSIQGTWKTNLSDSKRNFTSLESELGFSHKLTKSNKLVLGTLLKGKMLLNNNFEFYQGATLGGDYDLRGYRNERFLGKQSFFQSTDLRWNIGKIKSIIPMSYGILGGYDYGRVWLDGEDSNKWHQSVGGGIWLNGLDLVTARLTFFNSQDGNRIAFGLGFGF